MSILASIVGALMLATPPGPVAEAVPNPPSVKMEIPEEYRGGSGMLKVFFALDRYTVETMCNDFDPTYITYACYWPEELTGKGQDYIVSPNPCDYPEAKDVYSYAHLMCHEKAHKNGWEHN